MKLLILTEEMIRNCITMDNASLLAIEKAFVSLSKGEIKIPPVVRIDFPERNGEIDIKTAHIEEFSEFAIKLASGFFDNKNQGLPTSGGMMIVISSITGFIQALLLDNGYLTDIRTGLAGAIAAKYLSPKNVHSVGIIGAGNQARYQAHALSLVRKFDRILVHSIIHEEAIQFSREMSEKLQVEVIPTIKLEDVVVQSDTLITTTPSRKPYVRPEWIHPGMHITCMGADAEDKQELFPEVFKHADKVFCDYRAQCFQIGELHHAYKSGIIKSREQVIELGELILAPSLGRQSEYEVTICDLTGVGVQDTAISLMTLERAKKRQLGTVIETSG